MKERIQYLILTVSCILLVQAAFFSVASSLGLFPNLWSSPFLTLAGVYAIFLGWDKLTIALFESARINSKERYWPKHCRSAFYANHWAAVLFGLGSLLGVGLGEIGPLHGLEIPIFALSVAITLIVVPIFAMWRVANAEW